MGPFPEVTLLKTRFHKLTVEELIDYIVHSASNEQKTIVANVNVRAMNFAFEMPWFRDFINKSELVFCDGFGVLLAARWNGYSMKAEHRMTAPDYLEDLAMRCEKHNVSLFLLAGAPGVTDKALAKLSLIAPNLRMAGHHGYFDKSGPANDAAIAAVNRFRPDILYVGFGMPLQERWILENFDKIDTRVFLPLGACLDFYTNTTYRGPRWVTDNGLEWLVRLAVEPRRLWDRYIVGNPLFVYRVLKARITGRQ